MRAVSLKVHFNKLRAIWRQNPLKHHVDLNCLEFGNTKNISARAFHAGAVCSIWNKPCILFLFLFDLFMWKRIWRVANVLFVAIIEPMMTNQEAKDYLSRQVNPTLLTGLTELCKRKPAHPIVSYNNKYLDLPSIIWAFWELTLNRFRTQQANEFFKVRNKSTRLTHSMPVFNFFYPLKTAENLWFLDVLRGYRNGPLAWKGLMYWLLFLFCSKWAITILE